MTAHNHRTIVPGCYRCDLGRDEARDAMAEELAESRWPERYIGDLTKREWDELYAEVDALSRTEAS